MKAGNTFNSKHISKSTQCPHIRQVKTSDLPRMTLLLLAAAAPFIHAADAKLNAWQGDIEAGLILSEGNTSSKTIKTGANTTYESTKWRQSAAFESLKEEQESESTAEKYFAEAKSGYKFTELDYAFAYLNYTADRFTAFDYQTSASVGYGRVLVDTGTHRWDAEIGPGYRLTEYQAGFNDEESIAHIGSTYRWNISDTAHFEQTLLVESGAENTVTRAKSALITKINSAFSMKLGYTLTYNEEVPQATEHADKETSVSLLYSY